MTINLTEKDALLLFGLLETDVGKHASVIDDDSTHCFALPLPNLKYRISYRTY